jgi:hypothetical protein
MCHISNTPLPVKVGINFAVIICLPTKGQEFICILLCDLTLGVVLKTYLSSYTVLQSVDSDRQGHC